MTDKKTPETLNDVDVDGISGGPAYVKLGDIEGQIKNSFELIGKRTPSRTPVPSEEVTLGYTEVEWTY